MGERHRDSSRIRSILLGVAGLILAAACTLTPEAPRAFKPAETARGAPGAGQVVTLPTLARRPTGTFTPAPSSTPAAPQVCPPFPGYTQPGLLAAISNPFNPPPLGSDDPHQAIDLAVIEASMAQAGGPVQAALAGQVAMVVRNRFPYGNAVLIETPLAALPANLIPGGALPTPAPTLPPHPVLTCPAVDAPASERRSLYLLYAHLADTPKVEPGQPVACGALLGAVGQTGNALNPHLHLEARLGPSGARFDGMAHYENAASAEEMGNYCLWRVSNLFQLVDPRLLFSALP